MKCTDCLFIKKVYMKKYEAIAWGMVGFGFCIFLAVMVATDHNDQCISAMRTMPDDRIHLLEEYCNHDNRK